MEFDYFYGRGAEGYQFIMLPKILLEDEYFKNMSIHAKVLYSIYLSRISLSYKNGWVDENNRVFIICTVEEIMKKLQCCKQKALDTNMEMEEIGLIEKRRQGLGKPNLIYVKNFMSVFKDRGKTSRSQDYGLQEVYKTDFKNPEIQTSRSLNYRPQEVYKTDFKNPELQNTGGLNYRPQEVYKTGCNYIDNNKIDNSYIAEPAETKKGTFLNVNLSDEQERKLSKTIPNLNDYIERLSAYMQSTGKDYRDHASTIMTWYLKDKSEGKACTEKVYTGDPSEYESEWNLNN